MHVLVIYHVAICLVLSVILALLIAICDSQWNEDYTACYMMSLLDKVALGFLPCTKIPNVMNIIKPLHDCLDRSVS